MYQCYANESTATVEDIDLDGYTFKGLCMTRLDSNDIEIIVDLATGTVYELSPVTLDVKNEDENHLAHMAEVEVLKRCLEKIDS